MENVTGEGFNEAPLIDIGEDFKAEAAAHYSFEEPASAKQDPVFSGKILSFGELAKMSWGMFKERSWRFLMLLLVGYLFGLIILGFSALTAVVIYNFVPHWIGVIIIGLIIVAFIVVLIAFSLACGIVQLEIVKGNKDKIKKLFIESVPRIIPYFKTSILYSLAIAIFYLIFFFVPAALLAFAIPISALSENIYVNVISWVSILVFGIVFLVQMLYFILLAAVGQKFSFFALIIDGRKSATESIAYAYDLARKNKRMIFSNVLSLYLVFIVISLPFSMLSEYNDAFSILNLIVSFVTGFWSLMFIYLLYMNLKAVQGIDVDPESIKKVQKYAKVGVLVIVLFLLLLMLPIAYAFKNIYSNPQNFLNNIQQTQTDVRSQDSVPAQLDDAKKDLDSDSDGLSDVDEKEIWKTDPQNADTDSDGYKDGEEVKAGYDPLTTGQLDSDSDRIGDATEKKLGTDPNKFDTDGDGLSDREEIEIKRDPLVKD